MGKYERLSARKNENKIVPMPLDANFFFERAIYHLDRNNLSKALKYFWKIVDVEPNNPVHYCNLAGILSEMGRFKESNDLLLYVIENLDSNLSECFYYIANNYAYLEDMEMSFRYIHRYLDADPQGEYADEATEMLSYITTEFEDFDFDFEDNDDKDLALLHYKAKNLLEDGKFVDAIRKLKDVVEDHPDFAAARNNLSLAYFYVGNYVKAIEQANEVLKKDMANVHALSNLAIFYQHTNDMGQFNKVMNALRKVYPFKREHLYKLATTFAIIGEHELAYKHLSKIILDGDNLNPVMLHYGAIASFNVGNPLQAKRWWEKIKKLDQDSDVASFYLDIIDQMDEEMAFPIFAYQYELPFDQLTTVLQSPIEEHNQQFAIVSYVWGLTHADDKLKEKIILSIATMKSDKAEATLRDFLIEDDQPYYLKQKALIALEEMDAKPPYTVEMNGELVEMERQTPNFSLWKNNWLEVLNLLEENIVGKYGVIELYDAKTLWFEFINKTYPRTPQIRKIEGWVAAIEYLIAKMHLKPVSIGRLAAKYDVSIQTVRKHVEQFEEVLKVNNKINQSYSL